MRKEERVMVPKGGGRDEGKVFLITEMSALQAEKWAWRLVVVLKGTQSSIPDDVARLGMVGITVRMINAFLTADINFPAFEALLDEMMTCVSLIRDPRVAHVSTPLTPTDIEEVTTVGWLRSEVLRVHTGFSVADGMFQLILALQSAASSNTPTSPP